MRLIFNSIDEYEKWINLHGRNDRFEAYLEGFGTFTISPIKTSRPLLYAYYKANSPDEVKRLTELITSHGLALTKLQRVDWDVEKSIGVGSGIQ